MIRVLVGQHFGALKCHQNRVGREEMRGGGRAVVVWAEGWGTLQPKGSKVSERAADQTLGIHLYILRFGSNYQIHIK